MAILSRVYTASGTLELHGDEGTDALMQVVSRATDRPVRFGITGAATDEWRPQGAAENRIVVAVSARPLAGGAP